MERVLIVDPSQILRSHWKRALNSAGFAVVEAESGEELYGCLVSQQIGLIITELHFEKGQGLEMIKLLKNSPLYSGIPIMVASDEKRRFYIEEVLRLGVVDYLLKPFPATKLVRRVLQLTEQFNYA